MEWHSARSSLALVIEGRRLATEAAVAPTPFGPLLPFVGVGCPAARDWQESNDYSICLLHSGR
jgi:hypothetical protein